LEFAQVNINYSLIHSPPSSVILPLFKHRNLSARSRHLQPSQPKEALCLKTAKIFFNNKNASETWGRVNDENLVEPVLRPKSVSRCKTPVIVKPSAANFDPFSYKTTATPEPTKDSEYFNKHNCSNFSNGKKPDDSRSSLFASNLNIVGNSSVFSSSYSKFSNSSEKLSVMEKTVSVNDSINSLILKPAESTQSKKLLYLQMNDIHKTEPDENLEIASKLNIIGNARFTRNHVSLNKNTDKTEASGRKAMSQAQATKAKITGPKEDLLKTTELILKSTNVPLTLRQGNRITIKLVSDFKKPNLKIKLSKTKITA
jgi:hypothetical protein